MEQRFYKVKLGSGRVIGPVDIERIKLFIIKNKITGLETVRLYPTGDWKDINSYPEIADLLLQKLEGRLNLEVKETETELEFDDETGASKKVDSGITIQPHPPQAPEISIPKPETRSEITPSVPKETEERVPTKSLAKEDATFVQTADHEKTMVAQFDPDKSLGTSKGISLTPPTESNLPVEVSENYESADSLPVYDVKPEIAQEKTAFINVGSKNEKTPAKKKKLFLAVLGLALFVIFFLDDNKPKKEAPTTRFIVEMPGNRGADPTKSEKAFVNALTYYNSDTVSGYKKAAELFKEAAEYDTNNVRAICLLASSYMNLIDVVNKDENYFNVITRLIEVERAKGLDLPETVIADVELYHVLGNPDAAFQRIVDFSKGHQYGIEMFYYLALSFYMKGQYPEALKQLNNIDPKNYFSPRINYLYGLIYEKNMQGEDALKAFQEVVSRSPQHVKARTKLAELYFQKDNMPESSKHSEYVITHPEYASKEELAKSYYYHAKALLVASRYPEALKEIELALKGLPEDPDVVLEYYTLKARLGASVNEAPGVAKMFNFLALGEKALKEKRLNDALAEFLNARRANEADPLPLLRVAEIFLKKGDLQSAKSNLEKAIKLDPKRKEIYPKYIKTLTDAYEFEDASRALISFKELNPPVSTVDKLQGDLYFKQEKLQEANAYYKRALGASNVDSTVYVSYANVLFKVNDFRGSAFFYGLALRFDPFNTGAIVGIGKALSELDTIDKGVNYVQGMLQVSPHKAALMNGIAEIYVRKGDHTSALKFAENALTIDPSYAQAFKTKGDAFAAQDKTKEALDAYLTFTNLMPLDPTGHIERYRIYLRKLDLKAAKESIQRVIKTYPKYPGGYYMLGELYREGQNYESSYTAAMEEIKNNPYYVPAYVLAATNLNLNKDHVHALEIANKALKIDPNYVPALLQAGIANHLLKTYAAAQALLERALQLDAGNPQIRKRLGVLYHELGNRDKARENYKAYIDLYPDAPDRADVEKYLNSN